MSVNAGMGAETHVLIVDDDEAVLRSMARVLREEYGAKVVTSSDSRRVPEILGSERIDVVLLDLTMPHVSGEELLGVVTTHHPDLPVVIVTATDDVETAVRCVKAGAFDYMVKPIDYSRLVTTVTRAIRERGLRKENRELRRRVTLPALHRPEVFAGIVTQSPSMWSMFNYIEAIAPSPEPELIVGETGVGKELVAQALHDAAPHEGAFVAVNIAGLDDTAFTDTLFGHIRGAFTGANQARDGLVEKASGGSLFLDEIGDLSVDAQTKLLRLIQEGEFLPLGADRTSRSNCRVITATNRDLRAAMRTGAFREDLYYRLNAHLVRVSPLRERRGDIPLLVDLFLAEAADHLDRKKPTPPPALHDYLCDYSFPGNVRELRAMVLDAVTQHDRGVLSLRPFVEYLDRVNDDHCGETVVSPPESGVIFGTQLPTLKKTTRLLFHEALRRAGGNQSAAAQMLGVSRRTVNRFAVSDDPGTNVDP